MKRHKKSLERVHKEILSLQINYEFEEENKDIKDEFAKVESLWEKVNKEIGEWSCIANKSTKLIKYFFF